MKIYLYSRVSTDQQTLDQQERTAVEWLTAHSMQVDEIISDEGVSGKISYKERSLGRTLIPRLQPGDLLIVSEISRLGRSMADLSLLINTDLKERRVRLVIVSMGIDLDCNNLTAMDQLILSNFAFAGQLERELISSRTQSALDVRRGLLEKNGGWVSKKGNWTTGFGRTKGCKRKPTGEALRSAYKHKFGQDPIRRRQWLSMVEMRKHGESFEAIASSLNAVGDYPPRGGMWTSGQVYYALDNWGKYFEK